jgi:hypothetical protein
MRKGITLAVALVMKLLQMKEVLEGIPETMLAI